MRIIQKVNLLLITTKNPNLVLNKNILQGWAIQNIGIVYESRFIFLLLGGHYLIRK